MIETASRPDHPAPARRSFRGIFTRYALGSVLAAAASEVTLLLAYGTGLLGPKTASVAAWAAGAVVNYGLNRWWAWGRRDRARVWRELVPYWAITLASLALATWATGVADRVGPRLFESGALQLAFVGAVYISVNGLMFVAKFVLYHYFVFAGRPETASRTASGGEPAERRSRHQVPITTRK